MSYNYGRMTSQMQGMMPMGQQPFMGGPRQPMQAMPAPQGQMSQPMQAPANYTAIAQQMGPQAPQQPRMGFGVRSPGRGMAA